MQFAIEFQFEHPTAAIEAVCQEIATSEEMLGSMGESLGLSPPEQGGLQGCRRP